MSMSFRAANVVAANRMAILRSSVMQDSCILWNEMNEIHLTEAGTAVYFFWSRKSMAIPGIIRRILRLRR
jgi:hypothetical protein